MGLVKERAKFGTKTSVKKRFGFGSKKRKPKLETVFNDPLWPVPEGNPFVPKDGVVPLVGPESQSRGGVWIIHSKEELIKLRDLLMTKSIVGVDTETIGCDPFSESPVGKGRIWCWSVAYFAEGDEEDEARLGHHPLHPEMPMAQRVYIPNYGIAEEEDWLEVMRPWLEGEQYRLTGQNFFGYDRHIFRNHGITVNGIEGDTLYMSKLWDVSRMGHGLKDMCDEWLGYVMRDMKKLFTKPYIKKDGTPGKKMEWVPMPDVVKSDTLLALLIDYASLDAKAQLELFWFLREKLKKYKWRDGLGTMWDYHCKRFNLSLYQLNEAENTGFLLDDDWCSYQAERCQKHLDEQARKLRPWMGCDVSLTSWQQLAAMLYGDGDTQPGADEKIIIKGKGFPVSPLYSKGKTPINYKTGEYTKQPTDKVALAWLEGHLPRLEDRKGIRALQAWKTSNQMKKYLTGLPTFQDRKGRVHTSLGPRAETGRLTAKLPALQQIPARNDLYNIRESFICDSGYCLIGIDYSQLEMRVLAHYLIALFDNWDLANDLSAGDLHSQTAKRVFGPLDSRLDNIEASTIKSHVEEWVRDYRNKGKIVNFSVNYGKTHYGLGNDLRDEEGEPIGPEAAKVILQAYFRAYPAIRQYQKWAIKYSRKFGYARSLDGRYRPLPKLFDREEWKQREGERQALNTPIQASAADIAMNAALKCNTAKVPALMDAGYYHEELHRMGVVYQLQIHDELIFQCPKESVWEAKPIIEELMRNPLDKPLRVPLPVDGKVGMSWSETK